MTISTVEFQSGTPDSLALEENSPNTRSSSSCNFWCVCWHYEFILYCLDITESIKLLQWLQNILVNMILLATLRTLHKLKIIWFRSGKNQRDFMASYSIRSPTVYETKKQKDQLWLFITSSESLKGLFKQQTLQQPYLVTLVEVLCKWFTAMGSKGKPVTGPTKTETLIYVKQLTCTRSLQVGCKSLKNRQLKDISKWNTPLISWSAKYRSSNKKLPVT
jgi:hypothetical protein